MYMHVPLQLIVEYCGATAFKSESIWHNLGVQNSLWMCV